MVIPPFNRISLYMCVYKPPLLGWWPSLNTGNKWELRSQHASLILKASLIHQTKTPKNPNQKGNMKPNWKTNQQWLLVSCLQIMTKYFPCTGNKPPSIKIPKKKTHHTTFWGPVFGSHSTVLLPFFSSIFHLLKKQKGRRVTCGCPIHHGQSSPADGGLIWNRFTFFFGHP